MNDLNIEKKQDGKTLQERRQRKLINLDKLQLYKAEKEGNIYYGSVIWKSIFRARMYKEGKGTLYRQQQIINFKNRGINRSYFKQVIKAIEKYFNPDLTIALPGSSTEPTNIQKLLENYYITRTKEVSQMKYRENKTIQDNETDTLKIEWEKIKGNKILLIDDLITTGNTMEFYKTLLKTKLNSEFICYGLGINYKLEPKLINELEIRENYDEEIDINELLSQIKVEI